VAFLIQTFAHDKKRDGLEAMVHATALALARHAPTAQWLIAKYGRIRVPILLLFLFP
jgi:hypothetical protein